MNATTRTDIETVIAHTLEACSPESDSIDQAAVVTELIDTYGLDIVAGNDLIVDHDEFWAIVAKHDRAA